MTTTRKQSVDNIQDPYRQLGYLEQCLSSDKKPLGLFLGAGCPTAVKIGEEKKAPLIPDIAGITSLVRKKLADDDETKSLLEILDRHFKEDGHDDVSVEDMLSHIRALRAVAGNATVRDLTAKNLDKLDAGICQIIYELADKPLPTTETPYHHTAIWVGAATREMPVEIFTTNYDLLMEQAFEDSRIPYFDGFAGSRKPFFDIRAMEEDSLPCRWARLWKLHGSINWYLDQEIGVLRGAANEESLKRVIHPSHLKYDESRRMPYLAMIDRLRAFLKHSSAVLVLCGYSFRDDHINEVIVQGLQGTPTAIAFALLYDRIGDYEKAVRLARERPNLSLLARDGGLISGQDAKWPEKSSDSISTDKRVGVTWVPINPDDKEHDDKKMKAAQFTLGDFSVFGTFLRELVGQSRQPSEVNDGQ